MWNIKNKYALLLISPFFWSSANAAPLMYVPTGDSNELVIIDVVTDKIVNRIDELENAHGLSSSTNTEYLVAGSMKIIGPEKSNSASKPAAVSKQEHESHHAGGSAEKDKIKDGPSYVSIVHPKHGHVMRRIAVRGLTHHTAVSPDGKLAIAVHSGAGGISVIDLDRSEVIKAVQTGLWPNYAVFTQNGKFVYVSNARPGTVSEIETKYWSVVRQLNVGKEPEHLVLGSKDTMLYVANKGSGTISALNLVNGEVQRSYSIGKKVHGLDLSEDGRWLFAASKGENTLTRIDVIKGKISVVKLQPAPYHLAYVSGKNKLYVSSRKLPKIWVIDSNTLEVTSEIDLGKGVAHQMVLRNE